MGFEIFKLIILGIFSTIGAGFAVYKLLDKRLTRQDGMLLNISNDISALKAGNIGFVTVNACALNSKAAEEASDKKLNALETRLDKRITKLEDKIK